MFGQSVDGLPLHLGDFFQRIPKDLRNKLVLRTEVIRDCRNVGAGQTRDVSERCARVALFDEDRFGRSHEIAGRFFSHVFILADVCYFSINCFKQLIEKE
jgi:hypothetical protein